MAAASPDALSTEAPLAGVAGGVVRAIDRVNEAIGRVLAAGLILMAVLQLTLVGARYLFAAPTILGLPTLWWQEVVIYLFGASATLALGYGLRHGAHVRIDLIYGGLGPRGKAWVDLFGAALLLTPLCVLIVWSSWSGVAVAWATLEGSTETSGLPLRFLLKTCVPAGAALLALQGLAQAIRSLAVISAPRAG